MFVIWEELIKRPHFIARRVGSYAGFVGVRDFAVVDVRPDAILGYHGQLRGQPVIVKGRHVRVTLLSSSGRSSWIASF